MKKAGKSWVSMAVDKNVAGQITEAAGQVSGAVDRNDTPICAVAVGSQQLSIPVTARIVKGFQVVTSKPGVSEYELTF